MFEDRETPGSGLDRDVHRSPENGLLILVGCIAPVLTIAVIATCSVPWISTYILFVFAILAAVSNRVFKAVTSAVPFSIGVAFGVGTFLAKVTIAIGSFFVAATATATLGCRQLAKDCVKFVNVLRSIKDEDCKSLDGFAIKMIPQLQRQWTRFGIFLPAHAREMFFLTSIGDLAADCHERMRHAQTRIGQILLIVEHTLIAFLIALDSLRMAIFRRLANEFAWVIGKR